MARSTAAHLMVSLLWVLGVIYDTALGYKCNAPAAWEKEKTYALHQGNYETMYKEANIYTESFAFSKIEN